MSRSCRDSLNLRLANDDFYAAIVVDDGQPYGRKKRADAMDVDVEIILSLKRSAIRVIAPNSFNHFIEPNNLPHRSAEHRRNAKLRRDTIHWTDLNRDPAAPEQAILDVNDDCQRGTKGDALAVLDRKDHACLSHGSDLRLNRHGSSEVEAGVAGSDQFGSGQLHRGGIASGIVRDLDEAEPVEPDQLHRQGALRAAFSAGEDGLGTGHLGSLVAAISSAAGSVPGNNRLMPGLMPVRAVIRISVGVKDRRVDLNLIAVLRLLAKFCDELAHLRLVVPEALRLRVDLPGVGHPLIGFLAQAQDAINQRGELRVGRAVQVGAHAAAPVCSKGARTGEAIGGCDASPARPTIGVQTEPMEL